MVSQSFQEVIGLAKTRLYKNKDWTFIASLCSRLITKEDSSILLGATDGKHLLINPDNFIGLTNEEQVFLIAHETLHVAYLHMIRREHRDPLKWNMATDYVINQHLVDSGFKFIEGGLLDSKYRNRTSEEVYEMIEDTDVPNVLAGDIISNDEVTELEVQANVIQASIQAKMDGSWGSVPDDLKRAIDELTKPKLNWKVLLTRFIKETIKDNYSWFKPNRRHLVNNMILPSLYSKGMSKLTFAIDISGSVDDGMFNTFISEVIHALNQTKPKEIELILFNTKIVDKHIIKNAHQLRSTSFNGCGGTDVSEVIEYANKDKPQGLIIITDGYFSDNYDNCKVPLLWVIYDNDSFKPKNNIGKVINYAIN